MSKGFGLRTVQSMRKLNYCGSADGDYSDYPEDLISIVKPIMSGDYDFVLIKN